MDSAFHTFSSKIPRQALTWLAAAFYTWLACFLTVIGVTGTDGKTTTR
ncbi:MAG: hypothetical protein IPJ46_00210 [Anaerolineales bacterium]|nr:hypothetical protein [Anaerolineales bacterium]